MCRLSRNLGASTSWNPQGQNLKVCNGIELQFTFYANTIIIWKQYVGFLIYSRHCMEYYCTFVCLFLARQPSVGQDFLIHEVSSSLTTTHHSRYDSTGRVINPSQRPLPYNTQHSQQTDNQAPAGIRTHNLSKRASADPRLRPRGLWDRHCYTFKYLIFDIYIYIHT